MALLFTDRGNPSSAGGRVPTSTPNSDEQVIAEIAAQLNSQVGQQVLNQARNRCVCVGYNDSVCGGAGGTPGSIKGLQIGSQAFGVASTIGPIAAALNAVPIIGPIISGITFGLGKIFAHHAQAVQREQGTLCQVEPAVNQKLKEADDCYKAGDCTRAEAVAQIERVQQQALAAIAPIEKNCNAACWEHNSIVANVEIRKRVDYLKPQPFRFARFWRTLSPAGKAALVVGAVSLPVAGIFLIGRRFG